jgi:hypothetical protein
MIFAAARMSPRQRNSGRRRHCHSTSQLAFLTFTMLVVGCASKPKTIRPTTTASIADLSTPVANADVDAYVDPPIGWIPKPLKQTARHRHQIWESPTGSSAYGVIRFLLPFPVGHDLLQWAFMREMKRTQGEATLVSKQWDENLGGLRFLAEGGKYRVRVNLFVRGFAGWAVYAGTLRNEPVREEELDLAERAREHTAVGLSERDQQAVAAAAAAAATKPAE